MNDIKLTVEQAELKGWKFLLSVNVRGPYDSLVRNPKITVVFDSGTQIRRVPLLTISYTERNGAFLIYAQYSYDVRNIFYNEPLGKQITVSFDVMYGDNYMEHVPFQLGEIVNQKYDDDEEAGDEGNDDEEENTGKGDFYDIIFSTEQGDIDLFAKFKQERITTGRKVIKGIKKIIGGLWKLILLIVGICLLPVFIADAVLAAFGCAARKGSISLSNRFIYILKHARW